MILHLTFHHDPAHGWLAAPLATLHNLEIAHAVTRYSYHDTAKGIVYLEEDVDAPRFLAAAEARNIEVHQTEHYWPGSAPLRNLPRYVGRNKTIKSRVRLARRPSSPCRAPRA